MPKWAKILLTFVVTIIAFWGTARITGILQYYKVPTASSEPNIHQGQIVWTSNLKKPKRGDLVVYTSTYLDSINNTYGVSTAKNAHYLHRLCAIENDVVEMKDGVLFVNGENFDAALNLFHFYKVNNKDVSALTTDENGQSKDPELYLQQRLNDSFTAINLSTAAVKKLSPGYKLEFYLPIDTSYTSKSFKWYNDQSNWSTNNFGPLTIPKGCGFVLGDNRDNSMDSRYTGFIKFSKIKGVKL